MKTLSGNVLVTGATGGIGAAIARAFAAEGAQLTLHGRRAAALQDLARDLGARTVTADLASRADVARLAEEAGPVDILVANAALQAGGWFTDLSQDQIDVLLEVNLRSQIALTHALLPGMLERGAGHIVLISSLSAKAASPASTLYNASKFGLRGFGLALREDLRTRPVGVSIVLPGFIRDAGMFHDSGAELPPGLGTRSPDDVARAVLRAIRRNRAEVHVAPLIQRIGADIAAVAPELAGKVVSRFGGADIATSIAAGTERKSASRS